MRGIALLVLGLVCGCDGVFDIDRLPDVPECPSPPVGGPTVDDDQDGVANKDDNCPLAANADQHDEDDDGDGDACDLCAIGDEMRDADCDGIGDACDPDDTRRDARQFYGFGSDNGLVLSPFATTGIYVNNDALNTTKGLAAPYASAAATTPVNSVGLYETVFDLDGFDTANSTYYDVQIRWATEDVADPELGFYAKLVGTTGGQARLEIGRSTPSAEELGRIEFPYVDQGRFTLRVTVTETATVAELLDDNQLMVTLDAGQSLARAAGIPSRFALRVHFANVAFLYLSRTGPPL